ncbi:MAG TPA: hypothetical protein VH021_10120 [Trebonia sp.]|nr:hypothetical protein [Trebonia sp.]
MTTPTQTEPPFVPLRRSGWATRRTPLWVFGAIGVLVVAGFLVALSVRPSQSQQASDLRGYFGDVTTGVGSCAAALRDSMTSYQAVAGGDTAELATARSIIGYGATNCEVASNESLSDFANYQVTESLASLHLAAADNDVITWAFDATRYQQDMLTALAAPNAPAPRAALGPDLAAVNAERATIDRIWNAARTSTGDAAPLPNLTAQAQAGQSASGVTG